MKKLVLYTVAIQLFCSLSFAQNLFPLLGGQRVGTAAATFLKIDVGAEATAMGGASVAMANDASTLYWNPAAAAQVSGNTLTVSHIEWPVDIQYEYLGYIHHLGDFGTLGISMGMLHMAEMEVTTEFHPTGNGEYFSYYDTFGAFTYALKMTEQFSFGASLKFVQEGMADLSMTGWMIDVGTFYWTGFRNLRFAVGLSNFGPDMHPDGNYLKLMKDGEYSEPGYESFSPPTTFRVGAAMGVLTGESYDLTTSFQINHPVDNAENAVIGLDFCYIDNLHLRAGYRINYDEERLTFGAGFNLPVQTLTFSLDYAYKDFNNLGSTHQFTFNFQF